VGDEIFGAKLYVKDALAVFVYYIWSVNKVIHSICKCRRQSGDPDVIYWTMITNHDPAMGDLVSLLAATAIKLPPFWPVFQRCGLHKWRQPSETVELERNK